MQSPAGTTNLQSFEKEHCADILERSRFIRSISHTVNGIFDFDGTEDGDPVIYARDGTIIPLHDILTLSKEDFKKTYQGLSPREAFTNYLSNYTVRTAEDAIFEHNRSLQDATVRSKVGAKLLDYDFSAL